MLSRLHLPFDLKLKQVRSLPKSRAVRAFAAPALRPWTEIPGPSSKPELGGTAADLGARLASLGPYGAMMSYYNEFGKIMKHDMMGRPEVWIFHPLEAMKVFANEGKYPIGATATTWAIERYFTDRTGKNTPLASVGPEWRRMRMAMQKDLFKREAAESYLPVVNEAARASMPSVKFAKSFDQLAPFAANDLFMAAMLGYPANTVSSLDKVSKAKPEDIAFAKNAQTAMINLVDISQDITAYGKTSDPRYVAFKEAMDRVMDHAAVLVRNALKEAKEKRARIKDDLDQSEEMLKGPFLVRLLARGEVTEEEAVSEVCNLLLAGVDTTTNYLQWIVVNLAQHLDKQEALRQELLRVLGPDGDVTEQTLPELAYLNNVLRESHRMNPVGLASTIRAVVNDTEVAGYLLPANTRIFVNMYPIQHDPKIVDEPDKYMPERFVPAEVEKRKGTPKELIDHLLTKRPFSFGARMCLGARIAEVEIKTFLAHLLRLYKFELDPPGQVAKPFLGGFVKPHPFPSLKFTPSPPVRVPSDKIWRH